MLRIIKKYFCNHDEIETKSETSLNSANNGFFIVKTYIICNKCKKQFRRNKNEMCCHVMHIQYELIKECIQNQIKNQIKQCNQ